MSNAPDIERVEAMGARFSNLDFDEAVERVLEMAATTEPQFAVTPNVNHLVLLRRDEAFRRVYEDADLVLCDGKPVMWAMNFLGRPLREKISGSDLVPALCRQAAERGARVFFLGAGPGVARECAQRLADESPELKVAGTFSPPLGFDDKEESRAEVVAMVRDARPDLLLVALGSPRQERFIHRFRHEIGAPMSLGVGAGFDFVAGRHPRAPAWMRGYGMEWLWRAIREPCRLGPRYLLDGLAFPGIVWREWRRTRER